MIIPIRCFSCGKPIAQEWEEFKRKVDNGAEVKQAMDEAGLERYCCRSQFLGHIDLIEDVAKFKKG